MALSRRHFLGSAAVALARGGCAFAQQFRGAWKQHRCAGGQRPAYRSHGKDGYSRTHRCRWPARHRKAGWLGEDHAWNLAGSTPLIANRETVNTEIPIRDLLWIISHIPNFTAELSGPLTLRWSRQSALLGFIVRNGEGARRLRLIARTVSRTASRD